MEIIVVNTAEEAEKYKSEGYCPVECCFGDVSVVDELELDHHANFSHKPPVCKQALEFYGKRADDPRFVVTGFPDADACMAIALLTEIVENTPETRQVIELVARNDMGDFSQRVSEEAKPLLAWKKMVSSMELEVAWYAGVYLWPVVIKRGLVISEEIERRRKEAARSCPMHLYRGNRGAVMLVQSKVWGFDIWYEEADIVLAVVNSKGYGCRITVGVKSPMRAEELLGKGGLKNVWKKLDEVTGISGWGGREEVGGSPRHIDLTDSVSVIALKAFDYFKQIVD